MTDEDALQRAIVANAAEDTPRLAYADWLEEHGRTEEAEYIRLDLRQHAEGPEGLEYAEHTVRCEELWQWLSAHARSPKLKLRRGVTLYSAKRWECYSRRFPSLLNLDHHHVPIFRAAAALENAFQRLPVRGASIGLISCKELAEFLSLPVAGALEVLCVGMHSEHADEAARIIGRCPRLTNLRHLILVFPITRDSAEELGRSANLSRLEMFSVDVANLTPRAVRSLAHGWFRNLRELWLQEGLPAEVFVELGKLAPFPQLHTLRMNENHLPPAAWRAFARSKAFPALRLLDLSESNMKDGQLAALAKNPFMQLTAIEANNCRVSDDDVQALVKAPWIESLQVLELESNRLGPSSAETIAACRKLNGLRLLNLSGNGIGIAGLQSIADSDSLRGLVSLQVDHRSRVRRPSKAIRQFLETLNMPGLRNLNLSGIPLGAHATVLADDKFRNLRRLALRDCHLTDSAARELLRARSLQQLIELRLEGNDLKTGVEPLADRRVMPRLSSCFFSGAPELFSKIYSRRKFAPF